MTKASSLGAPTMYAMAKIASKRYLYVVIRRRAVHKKTMEKF